MKGVYIIFSAEAVNDEQTEGTVPFGGEKQLNVSPTVTARARLESSDRSSPTTLLWMRTKRTIDRCGAKHSSFECDEGLECDCRSQRTKTCLTGVERSALVAAE